jgi:putative transposase
MSSGVFDKHTGFYNRRSIRLSGYDYSQPGAYFITICTHDRTNQLFGDVINGEMVENEFGKMIHSEWLKTGQIRPNIIMDEFIVMPDHLHGIIIIRDQCDTLRWDTLRRRGTLQRAPTTMTQPNSTILHRTPTTKTREQFGKPTSNSIPTIVRLIKSATAKQINAMRRMPGMPVWQRNYYERVIRNDEELYRIRRYMRNNPRNWEADHDPPHV